ncbi:hypothetical protein ABRY23_11615 [Melioribacteraceae bacterium 4301-Me]|uniref:hypothetical protein n=1 Tax=Pyranulibacter aquaticus TaxID=3163344 RepID=UPI00359816A4
MSLSKKQIKYIQSKKNSIPAEKIAKELNVDISEVKKIIGSEEKLKPPKYFYLILFSLPFLFFIVLEISLRIFNYGYNLDTWVSATDDKYMLNPDFAWRYFNNVKSVPTSIEDFFDKEKKDNAFRVFVLGGSSAAGYPYMPLGSFSRYIRKRLELSYPNNTIEVVNLSLTAVNSYTIRDIIKDVLEQKPDLILIYAGHNEYYGALGVGSLEYLGSSVMMVNTAIWLNKFKTVQLIKNFIRWGREVLSSNEEKQKSGTLMSRMAKNQFIAYKSETFNAGINQFTENFKDILKWITNKKVHVIIGTLASNLKDQPPFVSQKSNKFPAADSIYKLAELEYSNNNFHKADSLYRLAKDLDELRFRAPEKINYSIKELARIFNIPVADIDSLFESESPNGITGNNLMTDHLHPILHGYQLMGKLFYEIMSKMNYLPIGAHPQIPFNKQDSITIAQFPFSGLDSTIADFRIKVLKNDWPFVKNPQSFPRKNYWQLNSYKDSIAYDIVIDKMNWIKGHELLANYYLRKNDMNNYLATMNSLIYQYPVVVEYYDNVALELIKRKMYDDAYNILLSRYKIKPGEFCTKWLGNINLYKNRILPAIKYLKESYEFNPNDTQTLYNLAGAYALNKDIAKALEMVNRCLSLDKNYPGAQNLKNQLLAISKNQK